MHSAFRYVLLSIVCLVAESTDSQLLVVQQGDTAILKCSESWSLSSSSDAYDYASYFTIPFESMQRPFCINGMIDPHGLLHKSQHNRFTVTSQRNDNSLVVSLFIQDVDVYDTGSYVSTFILYGSEYDLDTKVISLQVIVPPGKAECFIVSHDGTLWPEVDCRATTGSGNSTLSCFQDNNKVPCKGEVANNGNIIRGIFWLILPNTSLYCCSHDHIHDTRQDSCVDFVWSPKIATTTMKLPVSVEKTFTTNSWDRTVEKEPRADRSYAAREDQTFGHCMIIAWMVTSFTYLPTLYFIR